MRKLSKKISMLMVLAMLVSLFSGIVSASAASVWSFKSSKYDVEVGETIEMEKNEYADFDLFKSDAAPTGYTVKWKSSDPDAVWVNAKTGQLRADKFKTADYGDKATISATFTNTATKKSATRSFVIVVAEKTAYTLTTKIGDVVLGAEALAVDTEYALASTVTANGKAVEATVAYTVDGAVVKSLKFAAAGEYTVVATATVDDKVVATAKTAVVVAAKEFSAVATGVKEITVSGDFAKDAKFTIMKGAQNVAFTTTVAADGKSAKLALSGKLTKGTYTVSYGDAKVDLAIEDEKVDSIVVLEKGGQVFTDADKMEVYVHYDVLNQYGESVRKSFDVKWDHNLSKKAPKVDRANGILTLESTEELRYNDMVVLTGVASGMGYAASETATMYVGLTNNVSSVKVVGVIKEGTTELLSEVPASFIRGNYQIVFEVYDRAGYLMKFDVEDVKEDISFTSLNPLLATVADEEEMSSVYIDGVEYGVLTLEMGDQEDLIKKGGVAKIQIISNKTGESSEYDLRVVSEQILASFDVIEPSFIIATNNQWGGASDVELAFEALDINGDKITDFRALYKAVSLGSECVELREQNDGTAKLFYTVDTIDVKPEKNFDYPVVFNVLVPGSGYSDTVRLNIKAKRVANYVSSINDGVGQGTNVLEGSKLDVCFVQRWWGYDFLVEFNDQYDTKLENTSNLAGRYIGVKVLDADEGELVPVANDQSWQAADIVDLDLEGYTWFETSNDNKRIMSLQAAMDVTETNRDFTVEFVLYDVEEEEIIGGSEKRVTVKVVDLNQCVAFEVAPNDGLIENEADTANFSVKGSLANGKKVNIPFFSEDQLVDGSAYITMTSKVNAKLDAEEAAVDTEVQAVSGQSVIVKPELSIEGNEYLFFDQSSKKADGTYADRTLDYEVTATIQVYEDGEFKDKETVKTSVTVGNYAEKYSKYTFNDNKRSWVNKYTDAIVNAVNGVITYQSLIEYLNKAVTNYNDEVDANTLPVKVTITKLVDGGKGLKTDDLKINVNSVTSANNMILNAEIGDTFVATYEIENAKHSINFTVGSDDTARFSFTNDPCTWR